MNGAIVINPLSELKKRVAELESLLGIPSRTEECQDRFRAGKRLWSPQDEARLQEIYPHESTQTVAEKLCRTVRSVYSRAMKLGLAKTAEYLAAACRFRGVNHRFTKGHVPANKGLRRPGYAPGRMRETQFKKGSLPLNNMPIGGTRLVGGYLYRKIADTRYVPRTRNWTPEHRRLWEEANGPVPPGHVLAFKNDDTTDIRLDNLECITRRELMARNTVHNLPKALVSVIQLIGAVNRQINKRTKHDEKHD